MGLTTLFFVIVISTAGQACLQAQEAAVQSLADVLHYTADVLQDAVEQAAHHHQDEDDGDRDVERRG